jgi:Holliday junction resolvasome RuvABC endonuclease subunit
VTVILAFDPGSNESGWCLVDTRGGAGSPITATYLDSGNLPSKPADVAHLLRVEKPDLVAVEDLRGFAYGSKGPGVVAALISSANRAGGIEWLSWALGIAIVEMTASHWRQIVLGNGSATDERIKTVIPRLIHGWPARSNVHTRDAGGLALGVAWKLNGKAPNALDEVRPIAQ